MNSPWLYELNRLRPISQLHADTRADVAIVGAGIAGVSTAFFTLKYTPHSVILIDADKVAHGASGHNAGQITSYFERPFSSLVEEFGLALSIRAQRDIENAWMYIEEMASDVQLTTPIHQVTGYAGFATKEKILEHLHNNALKIQGGIIPEMMYIALEWLEHNPLPNDYHGLYSVVPQSDISSMLETASTEYIACVQGRKGCTNSARLCEEVVGWMLQTYPGRFTLAEHTPISTIELSSTKIHHLRSNAHTISATHIVLCTNGFEHYTILDNTGEKINTRFHHMIHGTIGYMVGYTEPLTKDPTAKSYFPASALESSEANEPDAYFYLTRRPFPHGDTAPNNLICLGGPEEPLPETLDYSYQHPHSEQAIADARDFLERTMPQNTPKTFTYQWHGLMGYTPNSIRRIGPDPQQSHLYYNLGCNGIGILPSLYGARRISRYLNNETVEPSIFDIPLEN